MKSETDLKKIEDLRKVAQEATPGPWAWRYFGGKSETLVADHGRRDIILCDARTRAGDGILYGATHALPNMAYLAAFDPSRVLKLLKVVDALERISQYPNQSAHHTEDCELLTEPLDGEHVCTCGYWSTGFAMMKLEAREALAKLESDHG